MTRVIVHKNRSVLLYIIYEMLRGNTRGIDMVVQSVLKF